MASVVEFGLLGPLLAQVDGRPVEFRSPKHRIILAALLLNAARPVAVEELAYAVWGTRSPQDPRRVIQLYVARIRAALGDGAAGRLIDTQRSGYTIAAVSDQFDLGRFEFWRDRARQAAAKGDLDTEATALRLALAQWRGEPLADVPSEVLHVQDAPRLREQRLHVLDRRIQLDLHQRRHAELIGELSTLTAMHPFQERFWAYLMTALHATGRRADALEAYQKARRHLAQDLGIAPGEELQTLHAQILTDGTRTARHMTVSRRIA